MLPYQEKIPYKRTKNTPREHQEILQSITLLLQERLSYQDTEMDLDPDTNPPDF